MATDKAGHDEVILELGENDTDDKVLDLTFEDDDSGKPEENQTSEQSEESEKDVTDENETSNDDLTDDKDQTIAELTELNDKQLNKIIGTRHAEKEWANERSQLETRITELETRNTAPEVSPIDKWLSEQPEGDRNELTEADVPLVITRQERAYQAKQSDNASKATSQSQGQPITQEQVAGRLNEVWEDEDAKVLYHMADSFLTQGERTGIVSQLIKAKDGEEAARITKQVSLAIIERRGSDSLKAKAKVFAPKSKKASGKSGKSSQQSQTDDSQGTDDDELDFSPLAEGLFD